MAKNKLFVAVQERGGYITASSKAFWDGYIGNLKDVYMQQVLDVAVWAMNEDLGIEPEQMVEFHDRFQEKWNEFCDVANNDVKDDKEIWYTQAWLDERVKQCYPPEVFTEFQKRYAR